MVENLEARVAALETEVAELRELLSGRDERKKIGWKAIIGTFVDDPYYEKAMKYGRQYRESLRPKQTKKKKKRGNT